MKLSEAGFDFLVREEGLRLEAYPDAGRWAIGIGCQTYADGTPVKAGDRIDRAAALALGRWHVARVEQAITRAVRVELAQPMFDALVSLAYNIGVEAFAQSTLVRRLNEELYSDAAAEFDRWNQSQGAVNATLVARRARERALFESAYRTQAQPVAVPAEPVATTAPAPAPIDDVFAGGEGGTTQPRAGSEPVRSHKPDVAGSTPAPATTQSTETAMLPAIAWALASEAAKAVPAVAKILFDPAKPVPQRNAEAVGEVLGTLARAVKPAAVPDEAWNEQRAVEAVARDPALAARAQAALVADMDRLMGIVARGVEIDDASRDKAAERARKEPWDMLPFLADRAFQLVAAALIIEVMLLAIGFMLKVSNEALMILLTLLVGTLGKLGDRWGQLYDYRIGSSEGSKASGEVIRTIASGRKT